MRNFSENEIQRMSQGLAPWESVSFACGGWLQFYMFGVAKALQDCKLDKGVKYLGCSAGALAAVGLTLEGNFDEAISFCKEYCIPRAYGAPAGLFNLNEYVSMCIELTLLPKFKSIPKDTLYIAVTKLPLFKAERVSEFHNLEDLVSALLASCAAFPFSSLVKRDGSWYIDGGLSDFHPILDEHTVTVSPFYFSDSDIRPSRYVPLWWTFFPPSCSETIDWLYNLGKEDGLNYVISKGIPINFNQRKVEKQLINHKCCGNDRNSNNNQKECSSSLDFDSSTPSPSQHPFQTPRRVSMHRFLGYDVRNLTHQSVSFFLDLSLLAVLLLFWKPLALTLIYLELSMRLSLLFLSSLLRNLCSSLSITKISMLSGLSVTTGRALLKTAEYLEQQASNNTNHPSRTSTNNNNNINEIDRKVTASELFECFSCLWSWSLLMRFLSGPPSEAQLRKHQQLMKHSFLYRIFRHII